MPAAGRGTKISSTNSPGCAVLLAVGDEEGLERQRPPRRRPCAASPSRPSAISGGGVSPIGEPLAMLPPTVPIARTCQPPIRRQKSREVRELGVEHRLEVVVADPGAERARPRRRPRCRCSPSRCAMKTAGEMSRMNLVIQSPTSVDPGDDRRASASPPAPPRGRRPKPARSPGPRRVRMSTRAPSSSAAQPRRAPPPRSASSGSASGDAAADGLARRR